MLAALCKGKGLLAQEDCLTALDVRSEPWIWVKQSGTKIQMVIKVKYVE